MEFEHDCPADLSQKESVSDNIDKLFRLGFFVTGCALIGWETVMGVMLAPINLKIKAPWVPSQSENFHHFHSGDPIFGRHRHHPSKTIRHKRRFVPDERNAIEFVKKDLSALVIKVFPHMANHQAMLYHAGDRIGEILGTIVSIKSRGKRLKPIEDDFLNAFPDFNNKSIDKVKAAIKKVFKLAGFDLPKEHVN